MMEASPTFREDHVSQIPALQLLVNLGFTYLTPAEVMEQRGNRRSNVLLEGILSEQLRSMNRVRYKGREYPFTEGNIYSAVQGLKDVMFDGLIRTNEKIYDLVCLGKSLQQSIDGDLKSFTLSRGGMCGTCPVRVKCLRLRILEITAISRSRFSSHTPPKLPPPPNQHNFLQIVKLVDPAKSVCLSPVFSI